MHEDPYHKLERIALSMLIEHIHNDMFANPHIVPLTVLISQMMSFMNQHV